MIDFSLPLGGQGGGPDIGETAVHIPLDICNVRAVKYRPHLFIDIVPDILAGEIQHQLAAPSGGEAARNMQYPVRMGAVEIAVLVDHFRLHPDAEFHPQRLDAGNQGLQSAGQLFPVYLPIP